MTLHLMAYVVAVVAGVCGVLLLVGVAIRPRHHVASPCRRCKHPVYRHGPDGCRDCLCSVAHGGVV